MQNILLVDDDPQILETTTKILSKNSNYKIFQTTEPDLAINITKVKSVDLIISDWCMPHKDGMQLINSFKSMPETKNIPIIIISGLNTSEQKLYEAIETGAVDFMSKPISELELVARVSSALRTREYEKEITANKYKQLAIHAMYLVENHERELFFFEKLQSLVKKIAQSRQIALNFAEEFVNEMLTLQNRKKIKSFETYFNELYPNFTKRLAEKYPQLTSSEIRMCIFIRMDMDTKKIADLTYSTIDSVKTARSRIRKKLGLDRKINLSTFIAKI